MPQPFLGSSLMAPTATMALGAQAKENLTPSGVHKEQRSRRRGMTSSLGARMQEQAKLPAWGSKTLFALLSSLHPHPIREQDWIHGDRLLFYSRVLLRVICTQEPLSHFWSASSLQGNGLDLPLPSHYLCTSLLSTPRVCGTIPSSRSSPPRALGLPSVIARGNEISSRKKKMTCQLRPDNICLAPEWI